MPKKITIGSSGGAGGGGGGGGVPTAPSTDGFYLLDVSGGVASWVIATQDEISPGFTPTLAIASGGSGAVEIGTTWTPTFNANPATNAAGVSGGSIQDNQGNSAAANQANPLAAPVTSGSYTSVNTAAINTPGTNVSVTVTETKSGVTKTTNAITRNFQALFFNGFGAATTVTGLTQAGGNATAVGPGAALGGHLSGSFVGVTGLFGVVTPANNFLILAWHSSFGASHTFKDNLTGFAIPMNAPVLVSTTTDTGVACSYYVATSTNNLGTTPIQPYAAT